MNLHAYTAKHFECILVEQDRLANKYVELLKFTLECMNRERRISVECNLIPRNDVTDSS